MSVSQCVQQANKIRFFPVFPKRRCEKRRYFACAIKYSIKRNGIRLVSEIVCMCAFGPKKEGESVATYVRVYVWECLCAKRKAKKRVVLSEH